jgi:C4-dicarboxylate-specific signal transduction histidine kinase
MPGLVAVLDDLSEIKALEAEHRRLDRLAALGEMSAVVAHEIRNPVAGISAGIDYLTRYLQPDAQQNNKV